jgi:hypothetical protein
MKRWSLDARSQAPLIWSHRVGREEINVRSRRTNACRTLQGRVRGMFLQFADGALEDGNLSHRVAR